MSGDKKATLYKDAFDRAIFISSKVKYMNDYYTVEVNPFNHKAVIDNDKGQTDLAPIARQCRVMPDIDDNEIYNKIAKLWASFYGTYYGEPNKVFLGTDLIEILLDAKREYELTQCTPIDTWVAHGLFSPSILMIMNMEVVPVAEAEHISVGVSVKSS